MKYAHIILDRALTTKRPHKAESTAKFCKWLCKWMPKHSIDPIGNIHVDLRGAVGSRTLFVAHVDTVHRSGGKNKVVKTDRQWSADGAPLGADDGAGVAILMHMIDKGVPGYYIFTQGEECGGIGAKYLADNNADLLRRFDRAVAFDRRSTYSVISHQGYGQCCSDEFADALSDALNSQGMLYMSDDTGVYTDTAEFVDFIPECTNVSVGYDMEHSERETLDMEHFDALCDAVLRIEWDALPTKRDPKARDNKWMLGWGKYLVAADDVEFTEALANAFDGKLTKLLDMVAQEADPLHPAQARKQISKRFFTEEFLADIALDAECMDKETLLLNIFDQAGVFV